MLGRAIWDKLPQFIFEKFHWGNFEIFKSYEGDLSQNSVQPNVVSG